MPNQLVVGISDCKASNDPKAVLVTYALGSCVGIAIYDLAQRVGGLAHVMLPKSRSLGAEEENPFMFANTGVLALARDVVRLGGRKDHLVAKLAGGANMLVTSPLLDVGKRNAESAIETLKQLNIPIRGQSLGGVMGRTYYLHLEDGRALVRILGGGEEVL
jgi:chemotaxis protein CheD